MSQSLNVILSFEKHRGFSFHFQTLPAVSPGQRLVPLNLTMVCLIFSHVPVSFSCNTSLIFSPVICPQNILSFLCSLPSAILVLRLGRGST